MHPENCTTITELRVTGFSNLHSLLIPVFCILLIIYSVTCFENFLIIFLVISTVSLHNPMYLLLSSLSLCEILFITNFIPRILYDIVSDKRIISVIGCITQLQIFGTAGNTMSLTYTLMAYDRLLAISNPLRYSVLMSNRLVCLLISGIWVFSFTCTLIISVLLGQLEFCDSNIIDHVYCDFTPFIALSSSDTSLANGVSAFVSILLSLFSSILILLSYIFILHTILKIPSTTGRKKAFSTCSSHLIVLAIYYTIFISIYVVRTRTVPAHVNKGLAFLYIMAIPLVSPIIYTLKNQEIRKVLQTKIMKIKCV